MPADNSHIDSPPSRDMTVPIERAAVGAVFWQRVDALHHAAKQCQLVAMWVPGPVSTSAMATSCTVASRVPAVTIDDANRILAVPSTLLCVLPFFLSEPQSMIGCAGVGGAAAFQVHLQCVSRSDNFSGDHFVLLKGVPVAHNFMQSMLLRHHHRIPCRPAASIMPGTPAGCASGRAGSQHLGCNVRALTE